MKGQRMPVLFNFFFQPFSQTKAEILKSTESELFVLTQLINQLEN